ncbi:MAG: histidine phosphatase family protein [Acidobacteria bacterium]|nr:histidine phosphatase family protein [Acidobacteriota bacterium]
MQIYLLRHGIAEDAPLGKRDAERALTLDGKKKLRGVLRRAKEAGVSPHIILSSPYLRALETAEIARSVLAPHAQIVRCQALVPSARPEEAWAEIRLHRDETQVMCSSHEPLCSFLASYLLRSPSLEIDFKKGALLRVDVESAAAHPRGILRWMLAPKLA